jgi:hypothetical protein
MISILVILAEEYLDAKRKRAERKKFLLLPAFFNELGSDYSRLNAKSCRS